MGRRLLALSLSAVLPIGALCAPLMHAHADDDHGGHHRAGQVHAHVEGHGLEHSDRHRHDGGERELTDHQALVGGSALESVADPEQVTALQLFVADRVNDLAPMGLPPLGFTLPAPLESIMGRPPAISHAHDPPGGFPSSPRAPPARLP